MSRERKNGHTAEDTMQSPRTHSSHCIAFILGHTPPLADPLTPREKELLDLLAAEGLSNKMIARRLYIAVGTVEKHLSNIYAKLGVESRSKAIAWVNQQRAMQPEDS